MSFFIWCENFIVWGVLLIIYLVIFDCDLFVKVNRLVGIYSLIVILNLIC